ncbi:hypothetical protein FACS1894152_5440 [Bacilli bacterium]|nr:hypothetical protein FACS1894152_5440 [Bacilli bacterium]
MILLKSDTSEDSGVKSLIYGLMEEEKIDEINKIGKKDITKFLKRFKEYAIQINSSLTLDNLNATLPLLAKKIKKTLIKDFGAPFEKDRDFMLFLRKIIDMLKCLMVLLSSIISAIDNGLINSVGDLATHNSSRDRIKNISEGTEEGDSGQNPQRKKRETLNEEETLGVGVNEKKAHGVNKKLMIPQEKESSNDSKEIKTTGQKTAADPSSPIPNSNLTPSSTATTPSTDRESKETLREDFKVLTSTSSQGISNSTTTDKLLDKTGSTSVGTSPNSEMREDVDTSKSREKQEMNEPHDEPTPPLSGRSGDGNASTGNTGDPLQESIREERHQSQRPQGARTQEIAARRAAIAARAAGHARGNGPQLSSASANMT